MKSLTTVLRLARPTTSMVMALRCMHLCVLVHLAVHVYYSVAGSTSEDGLNNRRQLVSTENFDWKAYLHYNKDLAAQGIVTEAAAVSHYIHIGHKEGRRYNKIMPEMETFDWRSYLYLNPELVRTGITTEDQAWQHYRSIGVKEGRHSRAPAPRNESYTAAHAKLKAYIDNKQTIDTIPLETTNFVLYHLEDIETSSNSMAVTFNNVKLFASAVRNNKLDESASQNAFYWINVAAVSRHPLAELFPIDYPNVAIVQWEVDGGVMTSHVDTLQRLADDIMASFSAVFLLNSGARGPFELREQGRWMEPYRNLVKPRKVALAGATAVCSPSPHAQTHFVVMKTALIPHILTSAKDAYLQLKTWLSMDDFFEVELTRIVSNLGLESASMMHSKRLGNPDFRADCSNGTKSRDHSSHLASMRERCHVHPTEVNFVRWSGEALNAKGYLCNKAIATDVESAGQMEAQLKRLSAAEPGLDLEVSEALTGGILHDLYQSYTDDFWRNRNVTVTLASSRAAVRVGGDEHDSGHRDGAGAGIGGILAELSEGGGKVCFVVRTAKVHDPQLATNPKAKYGMITLDLDGHVRSLLRQNNPHWRAFYYLSERSSFSKRVRTLLAGYHDARLEMINPDSHPRSRHGVVEHELMQQALSAALADPDCRWISLTTAATAYGSEVVDRVLRPPPEGAAQADILMAPLDSKHFAQQDYDARHETRWDQRCLGIEAMLRHNLLTYTIQPVPHPGRVDFSAAFLSREKVTQENLDISTIMHGNATLAVDPSCDDAFCSEGRVLQHLVRTRMWSYARLPLDGLKSIVFGENSPTLCVASGNVWFDYPMVTNVGCISHKTLFLMAQKDTSRSAFDWQSFYDGDRLCLRLSSMGFTSRINAARKAEAVAKGTKGKSGSRRLESSTALVLSAQSRDPATLRKLSADNALPEDFDWREYLAQNPELQADGVIFKAAAIEHYLTVGRAEGRQYTPMLPEMRYFDWRAYLELNPDVPADLRTETGARHHFKSVGRDQGRPYRKVEPDPASWRAAVQKLEAYVQTLITGAVDIDMRNLIVYHVEDPEASESSTEVVRNNLHLFLAAVLLHPQNAEQRAFYLFNVVGGQSNPYYADIPVHLKNVAAASWSMASGDMFTHIYSLVSLNREMQWSFSAVFFTSTGVRGPLVHAPKGEWLAEFRKLLNAADVGIVGSTISCHGGPHVQTHFFGVRGNLLPVLMREVYSYYKMPAWKSLQDHFEVLFSSAIMRAGHQISSMLTHKRFERPYFDQNCTSHDESGMPDSVSWDHQSWCELEFHDVVFVRWGAEPPGDPAANRYLCGKGIDMSDAAIAKMEDSIQDIAGSRTLSQKFSFTLPETPFGGILHDLFKQYRQEMWRERNHVHDHDVPATGEAGSQVCFLVRTSIRDDPAGAVRAKPEMKEMDLSTLIQSLLRQTDPNWRAFFYITDLVPFESRLRKILKGYGDKRLKYLAVDSAFRPAFTREDAGYTATDYVTNIVKNQRECRLISITNGDNVYGSDVVASVRRHPAADMLLAPLDSRTFAEHDYHKRQESELSDRCKGIYSMLRHNLLTYTAQPIPFLGRVDLAAVFLDRRKLAAENVSFGNFTNRANYPCVGCQDGYLTQFLVRNLRWSYSRMPLDGLKSIVFHGPSPTWCIASGNVWFDYPHVNKVGCFSHETVAYLRRVENPAAPTFDWANYDEVGRTCLRLSKTGFSSKAVEQ